jgi:hypothetical protein
MYEMGNFNVLYVLEMELYNTICEKRENVCSIGGDVIIF